MKKNKFIYCMYLIVVIMFIISFSMYKVNGATLNHDEYALLASAIDMTNTNSFEQNINPQMLDVDNAAFLNAVSVRRNIETYADEITATSAYEFSQKYSEKFSASLDTSVEVYGVTTDISGKFDTATNTESYKQKEESYEYYYWYTQKYIVNVDWESEDLKDSLSSQFKRDLNKVNSIVTAKNLLRNYGTHIFDTYILGGKMELTKYFVHDTTYELSETEKSVATSLSVIVDTATVEAKVNGSVNLSSYESNSSSSSSYYSKLSYHAYGGNTNNALKPSDLFQYKTQFGTGTASGFLYEAWTNSFNNDDVSIKVISTRNARPIWSILDNEQYSRQIEFLKEAFDNMCYESYAEKCGSLGISCGYIDYLQYNTKGSKIKVIPYKSELSLPSSTEVEICLSDKLIDENSNYSYSLSTKNGVSIEGNILTIGALKVGQSFTLELILDDMPIYSIRITIKKEQFAGGYGTEQQPFLINTENDFMQFISDFSSSDYHYKLINNINLRGEKIDVGGSGTQTTFKGVFNGDNYTISNFTIKTSSLDMNYPYIGLFGKNEGVIKNLKIDNAVCINNGVLNITGDQSLYAGVLVGYNDGVISNCLITNSAIRIAVQVLDDSNGIINVGGIVGETSGMIEYSAFSKGNIYSVVLKGASITNVGGLAGTVSGTKINESYCNESKINISSASEAYSIGGIAGFVNIREAEDNSVLNSKISLCVVYMVDSNVYNEKFGYIVGSEKRGEFTSCYYIGDSEMSVAGKPKNNCIRRYKLVLSQMTTAFEEKWVDFENGPVIIKHLLEGGNLDE